MPSSRSRTARADSPWPPKAASPAGPPGSPRVDGLPADVGVESFAAATRDLGDRLVTRAVWHGDRCSWTADQLEPVDGHWAVVHGSVDASLYGGTAGIARFLLHLWHTTGVTRYRDTALGALRRSWAQAESDASPGGLFTGPLGTACVTVEAGRLLLRDDLTARGLKLGERVTDALTRQHQYRGYDVIDGLAGALLGCAYLAGVDRASRFRSASLEIGRAVAAAARRAPHGLSWPDPDSGVALCGLGHGASGVALGLLESWRVTGDESLGAAARDALRYEQAWFDPARGAWPDNRDVATGAPGEVSYPAFWCHGSAGIGLVRLRGYQLTHDPTMLAEAGAALHTASTLIGSLTLGDPSSGPAAPDGNFSICHGICGLIELLTFAADVLGQPVFLQRARAAGRFGLEQVGRASGRWLCGVAGGDEHPGLMLGLSGIGMCYLRLATPGLVPPASMQVPWPVNK